MVMVQIHHNKIHKVEDHRPLMVAFPVQVPMAHTREDLIKVDTLLLLRNQ